MKPNPFFMALILLPVLLIAKPVWAGDRYVATNGGAPHDGSKWSLAFTNIQEALNGAAPGETIYLAGQTFFLTNQIIWTAKTNVTIRGGYSAMNDDLPGTRDSLLWPTVITRDSAYSNRLMIVTNVSTGTLEQVTLTGGYQTNAASAGGGLCIVGATGLVLSACIISNNAVAVTGSGSGGGLYIKASVVTVSNCLVTGNSVTGSVDSIGGGIWMEGPVTVRDSVIIGNRCAGGPTRLGGGVYAYQYICMLKNCLIVGNTTFGGTGDGFRGDYGGNTLDQCTVANNTGAGVSGRANVQITVTNSIVWGNGIDIDGTWNTKILTWSDIGYGGTGSGCISADPLFDRLYYLASGSPCLDAGTNTASDRAMTNYTTRVDGSTDSGRVDLGYHYQTGLDLSGLDVYVATNGANENNGTNWANAYRTLTKALSGARDGTRIYVGSGAYTNGSETFPLVVANLTGVQILGTNRETTLINAAGSSNRVLLLTNSFGLQVSELTLTGGYQTNSMSRVGGGLLLWTSGGILFSGCIISNNTIAPVTGEADGGGIGVKFSSVTFSNCQVKGNTATVGTSVGGGLYIDYGNVTFRDSIIANNRCSGTSRVGGGIYNYLGVCTLRNCLVIGNSTLGGTADGIHCAYGVNTLDNCTVAYNAGIGIYRPGGGNTAIVTNSILWGNSDDIAGALLITPVWSNIEDGDNNGNNGCISAGPLFERGYYLAANSPCVDAGTNTASARGLAGYVTRVDGSNDSGRVDFGYHYSTGLDLRGAADVYVATNGNDGASGTNWGEAYRTITKALSVARDATRIHIGAGSYTNGSEIFPLTAANLSGLQILGANRETTVINAAGSSNRVMTLTACSGLTVSEVTLTGGYATNSGTGGGISLSACGGVLSGCIIRNNTVAPVSGEADGGGLYASYSSLLVDSCVVRSNTAAIGASYGGGIYADGYTTLTVLNSILANNRCTGSTRQGGGLYGYYTYSGYCLLRNCLVFGNTTTNGAGISGTGDGLQFYGSAGLENCTVANNGGQGIDRQHGGFTVTVTNSIVWGNGDDIYDSQGGGSYVKLGWCDIEDGDSNGVNGCISVDPRFVNTNMADYTLVGGSPCLNTGTNQTWMALGRDLNGNKRIAGDRVDMGAYESISVASILIMIL